MHLVLVSSVSAHDPARRRISQAPSVIKFNFLSCVYIKLKLECSSGGRRVQINVN